MKINKAKTKKIIYSYLETSIRKILLKAYVWNVVLRGEVIHEPEEKKLQVK